KATGRGGRRRPSAGGLAGADDVQCRTGPEPLDLLGAERVGAPEVDGGAVGLADLAPHGRFGRQVRQAEHADAVVLADLVVGGRVSECEGQDALLLEVGLVDAGERTSEYGAAVSEPGLHGGVLPGGALSVVRVANGAPRH